MGNSIEDVRYDYDSTAEIHDEHIIVVKKSESNSGNHPVSVCIVIPTYNEVDNILKLLISIYSKENRARYKENNILLTVLVVDDNSPDGTGEVVEVYMQKNPNVYLLSRKEKDGLGAAYIAGISHSMRTLDPDIIFEMDGDLSHSPEYIVPMVNKIREGADFVIGSRYVKGGSIPANWGIKRKLISKAANLYAKTLLGISEVNDCTGGFRAIRTSFLQRIDLRSLRTKGYAFQISLLEQMRRQKAVMREVPIAFKDRTDGTSKMRIEDILEEGIFVLRTGLENAFSIFRMPQQAPVNRPANMALSENQKASQSVLLKDSQTEHNLTVPDRSYQVDDEDSMQRGRSGPLS
jgi:glycosyltransferase involved in cell wall biosynthesis